MKHNIQRRHNGNNVIENLLSRGCVYDVERSKVGKHWKAQIYAFSNGSSIFVRLWWTYTEVDNIVEVEQQVAL